MKQASGSRARVSGSRAEKLISAGPKLRIGGGNYKAGLDVSNRSWTLPEGRILRPAYDYDRDIFVGEREDGGRFESPWTPSLMPHVADAIHGWCTETQGQTLFDLASEQVEHGGAFVEIGSCLGRSASWLGWASRANDGPEVICVDTYHGANNAWKDDSLATWKLNIEYAGLRNTCTPVRSDSREAGRRYLGRSVSLLYIDAMHSYAAAKGDFRAWVGHCREGCIVAFDDAIEDYPGVLKFMRELLESPRMTLLGRADAMLYWRLSREAT